MAGDSLVIKKGIFMKTSKTLALTTCLVTSASAFSAQNFIQDNQLTEFRRDKGESLVWLSHENREKGLGEVGSSKDTAFGVSGSSRFRFTRDLDNHDFTANPGLSQVVTGVPAYTDLTYSLYYCDKKGEDSQTQLYFGVRRVIEGAPLTGSVITEATVHNSDLVDAPTGNKKCFRQVSLDFNSGANTQVEIFSLLDVQTTTKPDISTELQVRVDEFSLTAAE